MFVLLAFAAIPDAAPAAEQGITTAEYARAVELRRRLSAAETPRERAVHMARIYLRRAYVLDVGPAENVAKLVLDRKWRLENQERLQIFAWSLDAMTRGGRPKDITDMLRAILEATYPKDDTTFFIERFLGVTSAHVSPTPFVTLTAEAGDNGLVGRSRKEFIDWVAGQVERGENPAYILQIYRHLSEVAPSVAVQQRIIKKGYEGVRRGVPPRRLVAAFARFAKKFEYSGGLEKALDRILQLFYAGKPFDEALDTVVPPPRE
jgi:hypothetical protein